MNLDDLERKLGAMINKSPQVSEFEVSVSCGYRGQVKIDFMLCPLEKNGILTCKKTQKLFSFERNGQSFEVGIFSPCGLSWRELSQFLDLYALKITQICDESLKDSFLSEFFRASFSPVLTFAEGVYNEN